MASVINASISRAPAVRADGMKVSWGGVWGGVLVAVGVLLLLSALGVAVGISAAQPGETEGATLGAGAGIWAGISLLIALFIGGMAATRIGAITDRTTGFFEGALVWVVSVLLMIYFASSGVGMLAGGAFKLLGGAQAQQGMAQAVEKAKSSSAALEQKAEEMQPAATRAAWITFGALLLSLLAAVTGALSARRDATAAGHDRRTTPSTTYRGMERRGLSHRPG